MKPFCVFSDIMQYAVRRRNTLQSPPGLNRLALSRKQVLCVFSPEDRGDMFLRNVGLSLDYTVFLPEDSAVK
jgi:hypothetical protein